MEIDVQLAPAATTPPGLRRAVAETLAEAGLTIDRWIQPSGQREPRATGPPISEPTLQIVIVKAPGDGADALNKVRPLVAAALSAIRQRVPALPLGFQVVDGENRRWYTFGPTETAAAVFRGTAMTDEPTYESGAFGWSDDGRIWKAL